jgi:ETC complex I subunit conserved region
MRSSARLFATVKSASKYLEPHTPTGLTGLSTHPAPRPALIYTYRKILSKLTQIPPSSVYRQSAEALTKQRLKIVEETVPEGFDAWVERVKKQIEVSPAAYGKLIGPDGSFSYEALGEEKPIPWDGEVTKKDARQEGTNNMSEAERKITAAKIEKDKHDRAAREGELPTVDDLEVEPPLNAEQLVARGCFRMLLTTN